MSCYVIYYDKGAKKMRPVTSREEYVALRNCEMQQTCVRNIRAGIAEDKKRLLQFNYSCMPNEDGTLKGSSTPSNTVGMDIDHIAPEQMQEIKERILAKKDELGLLMLELSARGEGYHLVFRRRAELTQQENLAWASDILDVEFDKGAKDITRVFFTTTASEQDLLYLDEEIFETKTLSPTQTMTLSAARGGTSPSNGEEEAKASNCLSNHTPSPLPGEGERSGGEGLLYLGIPYSEIIKKYWEMFNDGEEPTEGNRNVLTYELAMTMRAICDYDLEKMLQVIPNYWAKNQTDNHSPSGARLCRSYERSESGEMEGASEWRKTIQNALGEPRKGMPYRLKQVLKALKAGMPGKSKLNTLIRQLPPEPPARVSPLQKLMAENVNSPKHKAIIYDLNAPLLAHLKGVQFRATDNTLWTPCEMQILCARQSSGKGCVNDVIDAIMEDIHQQDKEMNERLKAWKEKQRKEKTKSPRPQDIYRQILSYDTTNAALTQMNIDAYSNGKRSLYGKYNEIELLYKMRATGKGIDDLLRINFDHDVLSQGRVGTDSVDGGCPLHWNFNASTTPTGLLDFVKPKMIVNGTLSRLHMLTYIVDEGRQTQMTYGDYDDDWKERLRPYISNLVNASGVVECPQANKVCRKLYEENDDIADMYESEDYRVMGYRAVKLAWARTMVLYIAEGYKWTKALADYMRWSWKRDMWAKMYYLGDQIETLMGREREIGGRGPQNMLEFLPQEFSYEEYLQMRQQQGRKGDGKSTLRTWKTRGLIDYDEVTENWIKKI